MNTKRFEEIKEAVEKWWQQLQYERKCSNTYSVQKLVNNASEDIQVQVKQLISEKIKNLIEKCYRTKNSNDYQYFCNAINGCFDNFIHAADAVRSLSSDVTTFINFGLNECQTLLITKKSQKNTTMELVHSFSRVLILTLKLTKNQSLRKCKENVYFGCSDESINNVKSTEHLLSALRFKIGQFLMMDDILIETKSNFAMSAILIVEILNSDEKALIQYHNNFIKTISGIFCEKNSKLNVLKFLTCSAIINTWSVSIIDSDSTYHYLKFFIFLCEKYSSETSIVLNTSRTLLLLIRHDSFKNFISNGDSEKVKQIISMLLSCIFMLLEHPVSCVRHSAKHFLQLLANHSSLHSIMIDSVFELPVDKRSYFISIGVLANEIGTGVLLEKCHDLQNQLVSSLSDPTIVSHVSLCLEFVIMKDPLAKTNFPKWCETWIVPLLVSLMKSLPIVGADIEKLLERVFKKYPNAIVYVLDKWANPTLEEELRYIITALKICQKQGLKLSRNSFYCTHDNGKASDSEKERNLINERLLQQCLSQRDDDIRISAFSLLIEAHKTTKTYTEIDFKLILYFLKYNLNNQQPATRQKILGLVRKMLVRFSDSKAAFSKPSKKDQNKEEKSRNCLLYDEFLNSLVEFCFSNIFVGCNFNRLNTVLNILLLCFENVKGLRFELEKLPLQWEKLLIALDSSYEENKELAGVLAKKLELSFLNANKPDEAKLLFEKAFSLCTHMEPPDVLTGAYVLRLLIHFPVSGKILSEYFIGDHVTDDVSFYCIQILAQRLKEQIHLAKLDLMTAATCGPMYGVLFAIRLILKDFHFAPCDGNKKKLERWARILNELVEMSFEMTDIVGCVVNSSSPEGHLPNDFQIDFENFLSLNFDKQCVVDGSQDSSSKSGKNYYTNLIKTSCHYFLQNFNNLISVIETNNDTYEILRRLKALLKENQLLIKKLENLTVNRNEPSFHQMIKQLSETKTKLNIYIEKFERTRTVPEWPASAQVLLLCAWRTIKEASLYLGDLVLKLPVETAIHLGLLTEATVVRIGEKLKILLCEIKHRGAFEHAYIGFTQLVNSLWKCSNKKLNNLPKVWLEDIISELESPLKDQKMKLCSTRRSAGLPFLVQAIICSEIMSVKSSTPSSLHATMKSLFGIIENGVPGNQDSKIHALNILRALFKHAQLGEHVASYVSRGLMVAICGSRAAIWSERNSSSLLFSSLMIRIFGVARSRDEISKKNRMTSRTFFQRYSELYNFLLSEMEMVYSTESFEDAFYPKPSLYLVLLILGRLYPPPAEDPENLDLSEFLPYINMSRKNATMKIRELGARALVPLISLDRIWDELDDRFTLLASQNGLSQNERHGILLQIKELLSRSSEGLKNVTKGNLGVSWVENSKWMLNSNQTSAIVVTCYVKVLHILFKNFPLLREAIANAINCGSLVKSLFEMSNSERCVLPGVYIFLQNFYFVKTDILAYQWLDSESCPLESFLDLFLFMLNCGVSEVQSIPLRIVSYALQANTVSSDNEDDDFSGIGVPIRDLFLFQSNENSKKFQTDILYNAAVLKSLADPLRTGNCEFFKSKVIHRSWLSAVSSLVMKDKISFSHSPESGLRIDAIKPFIKSGDKDLSTSALICHAVYLMEEVSLAAERGVLTQDRFALFDILEECSEAEADFKERLAVVKILHRFCESFIRKIAVSDAVIMSIWMIPLKMLADEDPAVRSAASEIVYKLQEHILNEPPDKLIIKSKALGTLHPFSVPLRTQENLLDAYINILGEKNLLYLVVQMIKMALSSLCSKSDTDSFSKDEFGVFEKGNPNPFLEDLALSDLMCEKLKELNSSINLQTLLWSCLDASTAVFLRECFRFPDNPRNLMEVLETLTTFVKDNQKMKGDFSIPKIQVQNLRKAVSA